MVYEARGENQKAANCYEHEYNRLSFHPFVRPAPSFRPDLRCTQCRKYTGLPIILTAPTWVTVGPTDFWNRNGGTTNLCAPLSNQPCALSNAGVFATGLTGKTPLDFWIPKRLGNWYVKY
jgi:hypothetical protein